MSVTNEALNTDEIRISPIILNNFLIILHIKCPKIQLTCPLQTLRSWLKRARRLLNDNKHWIVEKPISLIFKIQGNELIKVCDAPQIASGGHAEKRILERCVGITHVDQVYLEIVKGEILSKKNRKRFEVQGNDITAIKYKDHIYIILTKYSSMKTVKLASEVKKNKKDGQTKPRWEQEYEEFLSNQETED